MVNSVNWLEINIVRAYHQNHHVSAVAARYPMGANATIVEMMMVMP